jgi:hypothetical protein
MWRFSSDATVLANADSSDFLRNRDTGSIGGGIWEMLSLSQCCECLRIPDLNSFVRVCSLKSPVYGQVGQVTEVLGGSKLLLDLGGTQTCRVFSRAVVSVRPIDLPPSCPPPDHVQLKPELKELLTDYVAAVETLIPMGDLMNKADLKLLLKWRPVSTEMMGRIACWNVRNECRAGLAAIIMSFQEKHQKRVKKRRVGQDRDDVEAVASRVSSRTRVAHEDSVYEYSDWSD